MSDIGALVAELIAAGCAPDVAAQVVASAFVAGAASANVRGHPVDEVTERRRAYDRERRRKERMSTGQSAESADSPISLLSKNIEKKERGRATRLSADWIPDEADRAFAKQLGWSDAQIDSEGANFRDYWIAKPGAGGGKLDWPATWRKWVRSSKVKPAGSPTAANGHSAKIPIEDAVALFAKSGIWSRHAPVNDISQVPADILAKHNLLPDGRRMQ